MKEAVMQVRMDASLKKQVEELYRNMGTSFAEAVRIFAKQSVEENAMPFTMRAPKRKVVLGVAQGKYDIPADIDGCCNDEITTMFGVNQ